MRKLLFLVLLTVLGCDTKPIAEPAPAPSSSEEGVSCQLPQCASFDVFFSPNGDTTKAIGWKLADASQYVHVQAYSFTSAPIAEALIEARKRKRLVEVIVDRSQLTARGSVVPMLIAHGVKVYVDDKHAIAHNKVMIIDAKTVITGSFNFTNAAEHNNAENCIFITDNRIAAAYENNWQTHRAHSIIQNP